MSETKTDEELAREWRVIPPFPEAEASNLGEIRLRRDRKKPRKGKWWKAGRFLSRSIQSGGYLGVSLYAPCGKKYTVRVHRAVCMAFHGPPPTPKHEVNHKDCDKINNAESNLEWVTRRENLVHAYANGKNPGARVRCRANGHAVRKYTLEQVFEIRRRSRSGEGASSIAKAMGIPRESARDIASGRRYGDVRAAPGEEARRG